MLQLCQIFDIVKHIVGIKTRISLRADFFLICKNWLLWYGRFLCLNLCGKGCISAYPVILSIGAHKASVQSDISCLCGRNQFKLCAEEVFFLNAVFLMEKR